MELATKSIKNHGLRNGYLSATDFQVLDSTSWSTLPPIDPDI